MKLQDKIAIVKGSTSGMGRAIAKKFAQEGAKVIVTGRNEERAKECAEDIKAAGGEADYVIVDTSNTDDCKVLLDKTLEKYGTVDILVNNAGMLSMSPVTEVSQEEWEKAFKVNVLFISSKFLP